MSPETHLRSDHVVGDSLQTSSIARCGRAAAGHARDDTICVYHLSLKQQKQLPVRIELTFVSYYARPSTIHEMDGETKVPTIYMTLLELKVNLKYQLYQLPTLLLSLEKVLNLFHHNIMYNRVRHILYFRL